MTSRPSKDSDLKRRFGPAALISGASDGIGRAFAVQLAEQGFDLILVARRGDVLQEMALDLGTRFGGDVRVLAMDLSDPSTVPERMALTEGTPVGLVVAAAGFGSIGPFLDQDMASKINMVDLNCRSVVELSYGFGQSMRRAIGARNHQNGRMAHHRARSQPIRATVSRKRTRDIRLPQN